VVLDDYARCVAGSSWLAALEGLATVEVFTTPAADQEDLVERLVGADVVIPIRERTRLGRGLLERLPALRMVALTGRNIGQVDLAAARELGMVVTDTAGSGASAPELAVALMLAAVRQLAFHDALVREGGWQERLGYEVEGKTLGVLGLGRVGGRVARIGAALGMHVLAAGPTLTPERAAAAAVGFRTIPQLFAESDVVSIHLRLAPATEGIVSADELAAMKRSAFLVNTARAALVDHGAQIDVLRSHSIAGAALDVYAHEPLPADDPLRSLDNVLLSPHLGYATHEAFALFFEGAAAQIAQFLGGQTPSRTLA
jgi:phosphoglycerate dehydrogenase-like enzyme